MKKIKHIQSILKHAFYPNHDTIYKSFSWWVKNRVIDHDEHDLLMSVMSFSQLQVRDVMVPRQQMITLVEDEPLSQLHEAVIRNHHSRYPIWDKKKEKIVGIVLAKDMISYPNKVSTDLMSSIMRNPSFVPESQRLDTLLRRFKSTHNHMAIVIDEFGGVSGLITIEDVLEQIVGDIEDEHDVAPSEPFHVIDGRIQVQGSVTLSEFNDYFSAELDEAYFDTIAGFVAQRFGYIPKIGDSITIEDFTFKVVLSDKKKIILMEVEVTH